MNGFWIGNECEKRFDDIEHANILKELLKNELNGHLIEDYISQLFHNICKQRKVIYLSDFRIDNEGTKTEILTSFKKYFRKWKNVFNDGIFDGLCDGEGVIQKIIPNLLDSDKTTPHMSEIKLSALQIELLQSNKLF